MDGTDGGDPSGTIAPWAPPVPPVGVSTRPPRRRLGWALVAVGVMAVALTAIAGWRAIVGPVERFTAPGQVTIDCQVGDHWRIGPRTSTSRSLGPLTVTTESSSDESATVRVTGPSGDPIDVATLNGSESFTINGDSYTAQLTFRCASDGPTVVAVETDRPTPIAVFPTFRRVVASLAWLIPPALGGLAVVAIGIVLVVRRPPA